MPEDTVNPSDIMIKFTGPEGRIIKVTDRVTNGVTGEVADEVTKAHMVLDIKTN